MPSATTSRTIPRAARLRSVRARTTLVATTAVTLVLVVAVATLAFGVNQSLSNRVLAQGEAAVDTVVERLEAGATPTEALELDVTTRPGQTDAPTYVAILDSEGDPVSGNVFDLPGVEEEGVGLAAPAPGGNGAVKVVSVGSNFAIAQRSVETQNQVLVVVAVSPLGEVVNAVNTIIGLARIGIPLLILAVAVITWIATGRTLQPIETIRAEVEALSSHTLDQRVAVPATGDEVSRLAETMNRMLARLDAASRRQREFVSDASHELRSPVASIRTELEVSLAHPADKNWSEVASEVLEETGRLERIIEDLLLLARFDEEAEVPTGIVDSGCVVRRTAAAVDGVGVVAIETDAADGLFVGGNADALTGAIRNLIDNAVRHAVSSIAVQAAAGDNTVVITVDDDGPGIASVDRERVFERFTRLDHPRSRTDGGVGLGLAVVDRVVRHHHGTVTVADSPLGGARFQIVLPAAT